MSDLTGDWYQNSSLLGSEASQLLLLRDALESGDKTAVVSAFALVARVCGLGTLAKRAKYDSQKLFAALSDDKAPDMTVLAEFLDQFSETNKAKRA